MIRDTQILFTRRSHAEGLLRLPLVLLALAAFLLASCDDPPPADPDPIDEDGTPAEETPEPTGYEVVEVGDAGSIAGIVRWSGERPELEDLPVRLHAEECGAEQASRALRVSDRGGVADAVVALLDVRRGLAFEPPEEAAALVRQGCRFEPHVLAVGLEHPLALRNEDSVVHNAHARIEGRTVLDVGLPVEGAVVERAIAAPGAAEVVCDAGHHWERAFVHVSPHPYIGVTGEDGRFRIPGVPPGQYTLRVWHEGWRVVGSRAGRPQFSAPIILTRSVSVSPRQETTEDFELSQASAVLAGD